MHFTNKPSRGDAIEDYRRQIIRMSSIVKLKLFHVRRAIGYLKQLFVCASISMIIMILWATSSATVIGYHYSMEKKVADVLQQKRTVSVEREGLTVDRAGNETCQEQPPRSIDYALPSGGNSHAQANQ
jgi:hypothetical protein